MKKTTTKNNEGDAAKLAVIGASIAGLAATAYFFLGPNAKKHQKDMKAWAIKMKGDVVDKLEKAKELSEPSYQAIIDKVAEKYQKGTQANIDDVRDLATTLKRQWKTLGQNTNAAKKRVSKGVKKVTKKIVN